MTTTVNDSNSTLVLNAPFSSNITLVDKPSATDSVKPYPLSPKLCNSSIKQPQTKVLDDNVEDDFDEIFDLYPKSDYEEIAKSWKRDTFEEDKERLTEYYTQGPMSQSGSEGSLIKLSDSIELYRYSNPMTVTSISSGALADNELNYDDDSDDDDDDQTLAGNDCEQLDVGQDIIDDFATRRYCRIWPNVPIFVKNEVNSDDQPQSQYANIDTAGDGPYIADQIRTAMEFSNVDYDCFLNSLDYQLKYDTEGRKSWLRKFVGKKVAIFKRNGLADLDEDLMPPTNIILRKVKGCISALNKYDASASFKKRKASFSYNATRRNTKSSLFFDNFRFNKSHSVKSTDDSTRSGVRVCETQISSPVLISKQTYCLTPDELNVLYDSGKDSYKQDLRTRHTIHNYCFVSSTARNNNSSGYVRQSGEFGMSN
ncbi:hypothetical protein H4219_005628 [Mycoemilia scoparia]|uniref:Uncharacterized protein n=1 Tax=Mycoemilia scoparia TaxID=417184 RepID=A0A9W7ZM67_9FUNG|nr:hypothetical protein H4219_005628 [Mycoemilia scoparia]